MLDKEKLFETKLSLSIPYMVDFDNRIIYHCGELTDDVGTEFRMKTQMIRDWNRTVNGTDIKDITIDISSYGGSIYSCTSALDFYDELLKENILVNTKAHTVCMSAATIIVAGGTGERTATKRCKFMLHDIQMEGTAGTAKQLQSAVQNLSEEQLEFFSFYAQFSKKNQPILSEKELLREAKKWIKKFTKDSVDHYISAQSVLELGLIDRVL